MTDEQKALVRAVATEVMGWTLREGDGEDVYHAGFKSWYELDFGARKSLLAYSFNPLTFVDSAGLVIGAMEEKGYGWHKGGLAFGFALKQPGQSWTVAIRKGEKDWRQAMCEAALEAVRSEKR